MTQFTPISSIIGGALIGLAAVILYQLNGRIAGISGITHGLLGSDHSQRLWRILFLIGLIVGGFAYHVYSGSSIVGSSQSSLPVIVIAGLLVGLGTRLGSGCTSGHGVCGIARLSVRSIVATLVFLVIGMVTATGIHWMTK